MASTLSSAPCAAAARITALSRLDASTKKSITTTRMKAISVQAEVVIGSPEQEDAGGEDGCPDEQLRDAHEAEARHGRLDDADERREPEHPGQEQHDAGGAGRDAE